MIARAPLFFSLCQGEQHPCDRLSMSALVASDRETASAGPSRVLLGQLHNTTSPACESFKMVCTSPYPISSWEEGGRGEKAPTGNFDLALECRASQARLAKHSVESFVFGFFVLGVV